MKSLGRITLVPLVMALGLAAMSATARAQELVRAEIPFGFTAGSIDLPPGDYVMSVDWNDRELTVRDAKTGDGYFVQIVTNLEKNPRLQPSSAYLVFDKRGEDGRVLSQVWLGGADRDPGGGDEGRAQAFDFACGAADGGVERRSVKVRTGHVVAAGRIRAEKLALPLEELRPAVGTDPLGAAPGGLLGVSPLGLVGRTRTRRRLDHDLEFPAGAPEGVGVAEGCSAFNSSHPAGVRSAAIGVVSGVGGAGAGVAAVPCAA